MFRTEKSSYLVKLDVDEIDTSSGAVTQETIPVPIDRIRQFVYPWLLPNLPSPPRL